MTKHTIKYLDLSSALYEALITDPFYFRLEKSVVGDKEQKREAIIRYMDYSMIEGQQFGQTFIPIDHTYGASVWLKPLTKTDASRKKNDKKEFLLSNLGEAGWHCYQSIVEFMSSKSANLISSDAWYLSIVGLHPSYQNRGLGNSLIKPILESTDRLGVMTYLETFTPRNIKFYERLGYVTAKVFNEPTTGCDYWLMVRKSKDEK